MRSPFSANRMLAESSAPTARQRVTPSVHSACSCHKFLHVLSAARAYAADTASNTSPNMASRQERQQGSHARELMDDAMGCL